MFQQPHGQGSWTLRIRLFCRSIREAQVLADARVGIQAEPQPGTGTSLSQAVSSLDDIPEVLVTAIGPELGCQVWGPPKTEETKNSCDNQFIS